MFNLAYSTDANGSNQQGIARSIMFMIQFTSEAARFNDVYGVMADIMGNYNSYYSGLPIMQQELENDWSAISRFAQALNNNSNPSPYFVGPHVGTLYNFDDVQRYMAQTLGDGS